MCVGDAGGEKEGGSAEEEHRCDTLCSEQGGREEGKGRDGSEEMRMVGGSLIYSEIVEFECGGVACIAWWVGHEIHIRHVGRTTNTSRNWRCHGGMGHNT